MVDTANLLRDPVSGKCVAVIAREKCALLSPAPLAVAVEKGDVYALATLPAEQARRVRLLPTSTVTGDGILMAVQPDGAFVDAGAGERPVELLLAFAPLRGNTDDCEALLPAELIG